MTTTVHTITTTHIRDDLNLFGGGYQEGGNLRQDRAVDLQVLPRLDPLLRQRALPEVEVDPAEVLLTPGAVEAEPEGGEKNGKT